MRSLSAMYISCYVAGASLCHLPPLQVGALIELTQRCIKLGRADSS